jgi:nucleoside-diphosphate-sugar epimerase
MANDNFVLVMGDVRDKERLDEIITYYKVKTIFHLAALVPYVVGDDVIGVNAVGTRNLLKSAYQCGVEEFIYSSSLSVYSVPPEKLPVPETHPTKPDNAYGMSKVLGEKCCNVMSQSMKTVIVRYAGAFGKGMEPSRVIPQFVGKALKNQILEIMGDGNNSSDFCYVDDLVNGTILAWQKGKTGQTYNIGSGQETFLFSLADGIVRRMNSKSEIRVMGNKIDRPFRFYLSIKKAQKELGYEPIPFIDRLGQYIESVE